MNNVHFCYTIILFLCVFATCFCSSCDNMFFMLHSTLCMFICFSWNHFFWHNILLFTPFILHSIVYLHSLFFSYSNALHLGTFNFLFHWVFFMLMWCFSSTIFLCLFFSQILCSCVSSIFSFNSLYYSFTYFFNYSFYVMQSFVLQSIVWNSPWILENYWLHWRQSSSSS